MELVFFVFLCITLRPILSIQQNSYKAAVVEHAPVLKSTPSETITENLKIYKQFVSKAKNEGVDLIVFPEYGLTTLVLEPKGYALNLSPDNEVLKSITEIASENKIYLVINLLEEIVVQRSEKIYYNTNLVIDRSGSVIAKYRKINLFNEPNLAPGNETVTFTTDFGATFGTFICWDILSIKPAHDVVAKGVTDVAYPLAWFNTLPFYGALSTQHGFVLANNVNLLVANYKRPELGNGGSGIFLGNGEAAEMYLSDSPDSKMITKIVPINRPKKNSNNKQKCNKSIVPANNPPMTHIENFVTHRDFKPDDYTFKNVDLTQKISEDVVICNKNFCCNFTIGIDNIGKNDVFKLMAFDGITILDRSRGHVRSCGLLACKNDSLDSCGDRGVSSSTNFTKIAVSGHFPLNSSTFYRPATSTLDLLPVLGTEFCTDDQVSGISKVHFVTTRSQSDVLLFGIYGQVMNEAR